MVKINLKQKAIIAGICLAGPQTTTAINPFRFTGAGIGAALVSVGINSATNSFTYLLNEADQLYQELDWTKVISHAATAAASIYAGYESRDVVLHWTQNKVCQDLQDNKTKQQVLDEVREILVDQKLPTDEIRDITDTLENGDKSSQKNLFKDYHPDKNINNERSEEELTNIFRTIHDAYSKINEWAKLTEQNSQQSESKTWKGWTKDQIISVIGYLISEKLLTWTFAKAKRKLISFRTVNTVQLKTPSTPSTAPSTPSTAPSTPDFNLQSPLRGYQNSRRRRRVRFEGNQFGQSNFRGLLNFRTNGQQNGIADPFGRDNQQLESEITDLESNLADQVRNVQVLQERIRNLEMVNADNEQRLIEEREELQERLNNANNAINFLNQQSANLTAENNIDQETINQLREQAIFLQTQSNTLQTQFTELTQNRDNLQTNLSDEQTARQSLEKKNNQLQITHQDNQKSLTQAKIDLQAEKKNHQQTQNKLANVNKSLASTQAQIAQQTIQQILSEIQEAIESKQIFSLEDAEKK